MYLRFIKNIFKGYGELLFASLSVTIYQTLIIAPGYRFKQISKNRKQPNGFNEGLINSDKVNNCATIFAHRTLAVMTGEIE